MLLLTPIGTDSWDHRVYEDQNGQLWKDTSLEYMLPDLYSVAGNTPEGEPAFPLEEDYIYLEDLIRNKVTEKTGWTPEDRDEIKNKYNLLDDEADAFVAMINKFWEDQVEKRYLSVYIREDLIDTAVFDTLDEANNHAWNGWKHLTHSEKKNVEIRVYYVEKTENYFEPRDLADEDFNWGASYNADIPDGAEAFSTDPSVIWPHVDDVLADMNIRAISDFAGVADFDEWDELMTTFWVEDMSEIRDAMYKDIERYGRFVSKDERYFLDRHDIRFRAGSPIQIIKSETMQNKIENDVPER